MNPGPILEALRFQRTGFSHGSLSSPLYAALTDAAVADVEVGGPCAAVLARTPAGVDPIPDALALRFLCAVHRLVLDGAAPALARYFPTAGGRFEAGVDDEFAGVAFVETVAANAEAVVAGLDRGVQTNEVGRCATLAVGFTELLRRFGLPLRLLEIGASAGLNLRWDRWRYESGSSSWGDPAAPLTFSSNYREPFPPLDAPLGPGQAVVERVGCDRSPIDPTTEDGRRTLTAFVWPDQPERHARLAAALDAAVAEPALVNRADAATWLAERLAERRLGTTTVVYHSIVWQYLPPATRQGVASAIADASRRANRGSPLAWLRMEPGDDPTQAAEVRLRAWPNFDDELLAYSGYHGHPVWQAAPR